MQKSSINLGEIQLIGLKARTNLANEINPLTSKIMQLVGQYFQEKIYLKIPNRQFEKSETPNRTFCAYTEYAGDYTADYTFFVGEEVTSLESIPDSLSGLKIPAQHYTKFTTEPGPMPASVINAWQKIWLMSDKDLGGKRNYHTDFEIYDERAMNPLNTILDVYIGLQP
ncbi:MAG: effector binding domain-containing protein [Alphaproteobacteria bacterium]|nr:effector binding domain-containing protein [Alphaproteobacteria bacterium]